MTEIGKWEIENKPKRKKCIICGQLCEKIRHNKQSPRDFCCLHVPAKYIRKPINLWLCKTCAKRYLEGENHETSRRHN